MGSREAGSRPDHAGVKGGERERREASGDEEGRYLETHLWRERDAERSWTSIDVHLLLSPASLCQRVASLVLPLNFLACGASGEKKLSQPLS